MKAGRITGVALLCEEHGLIALPKPCRHGHIFALCAFMGIDPEPCEQGFVTSEGRFIDRKQAAQLIGFEKPELFSEDIW